MKRWEVYVVKLMFCVYLSRSDGTGCALHGNKQQIPPEVIVRQLSEERAG